jgi:hypothetical protein
MGIVGRGQEKICRFTIQHLNEPIYEDIDFKEGSGDTCDLDLCQQLHL